MRTTALRAWGTLALLLVPASALAAAPTATTAAATSVTTTTAVLNGVGVPNGEATTGWFRYSTTTPGTCNDTFGTRVPSTSGTDLGTGSTAVPYSITTTGLATGTTYYFCAIVSNGSGKAFGQVLSFTTLAPPGVTTQAATGLSSSGATLNASINPYGSGTSAWFRYSTGNPGACNDAFGTATSSSWLGSGNVAVPVAQTISSLTPSTTYYFCAIADNSYGTSYGALLTFTTPAAVPDPTTSAATALSGTGATLNGSANPGGAAATGYFRYATSSPGTCNDAFGTRAPASGGTALGSGNASVAYSQAITGLTPGATYYYCAIASNAVGTGLGSVGTFTTPLPPTVTTSAATSVSNSTATLRGSGIANGATATGWFRYSSTNPGTCSDTFGSRAPTTSGSSLGSGYSTSSYAQSISGLSPGTTYYYCAIASNAEGTSFGAVLTFTTLAPPTFTTSAATTVTATSATLNGSANPNGSYTYGWFSYDTINPGTCNDSFGSQTATTYVGTTTQTYSEAISGLTPSTTYYFCALGYNSYDYGYGTVLSFTTPAALPSVSTSSATSLTGTGATLNGSADPGGAATTGWFRYATTSPGSCNDAFGTRAPSSGGTALGSQNGSASFSQALTGLTPGTTYYYCAIASNSVGTGYGSVRTFTTPLPPTVTTSAATSITSTSASLRGSGIANGDTTTGWFRYATTNPGTCSDSFGSRAPTTGGSSLGSGYSTSNFAQSITGLSPGTTYYFCAIASNPEGTSYGGVLSFTTLSEPDVTTSAATLVTATSATLNGSVNPNGSYAYGWFSYDTINPGTCDDSFGSQTATTYFGSGTTSQTYSDAISGLTPNTTYYFCAISYNSYGTGYGALLSFTTPPALPAVSTSSVTSLSGTGATLNGSADPGGAATTGWFRYATTSPGSCNDAFGTRAPSSGGTALGSENGSASFSQAITGLTPGATYYYCAIASNSVGTGYGSVRTFTTPLPPTVTTSAATSISNSSATLRGSAIANGDTTTGWFRYATSNPGTCSDTFGSRAPTTGGSALGASYSSQSFAQGISGLSPGTTYYYCAIASNPEGIAYGTVLSFTTLSAPDVTTSAATAVSATGATLDGSVNPNGSYAYGWFSYDTINPGTCNDSFGSQTATTYFGSGTTTQTYSDAITGLTPNTTYYFCAISYNSYGTGYGAVVSFTTPPAVPDPYTDLVTLLSGTGATLNGSADPGGAAATGWFRYATTSPGSCNDAFGTRAPSSGGTALGSGNTSMAYSQALTGLTPGTTYYYCAMASNSVGTGFGSVRSFTTPLPPTVTTSAATSITNSSATLRGSATANGDTTTGWFRYATTTPGTCSDSFGSRAPTTGGSSLGSSYSNLSYAQSVSGLSPGTTYYYCAIASNPEGTSFGTVLSFTTLSAPDVTTSAATVVTSSGATLNGSANPNGSSTYGYFSYSTTNPGTCNDTFGSQTSTTYFGSATTSETYSETISGLTPNTTYYFCAIAYNNYGTSYGSVLSFTTPPALPVVSTSSVTSLSGTGATLNGSADPGGAAATGWFRFATTSPGTCNDAFGTRAPSSGGTALGSGNSSASFSQALTGLTPGTTYYYCALASNSVGTGYGSVRTFTTPLPPTVTTSPATSISSTSATLRGSGVANGDATTGWFRYATTDPGTCNDSFGTRAPTTGGSSVGSSYSSVSFAQSISSLSPGTTYYYCAIASNPEGISFGAVLSFTTLAPPDVTTSAATLVSSTGATLNGSANPNGSSTYGYFSYSTTNPGTCNDSFGTQTSYPYLGSGTAAVTYSQTISGLTPNTTYYFCAIAYNNYGTGYGSVLSFTTPPALPAVSTSTVTSLSGTGATLNGSANPGGDATTGWFRYATSSPGACNDSFGTRAPASGGTALGSGNSSASFSQALTGLTPGTTYYYCAIASNSVGVGYGSLRSFTAPLSPNVATLAATPVTAVSATLNGTANPNGNSTTAWFRYSATDPGTCSDTFGARIPPSGGSSLGTGSTDRSYSQAITGLAPGTTYYFCAIAQSTVGYSYGAVLSFTTPPTSPSVTTLAASGVASGTAVLNGSANPNGDTTTTGWFRYSTTNPGSCNDTFGTRAPATGGVAIGGGNSAQNYAATITGLSNSTTYYFCAIASNSVGTNYGAVLTFNTAVPVVTTQAASALTNTTATLNGSANPNLAATTAWFRYSATDPGSCNDSFGTRAPASGGSSLGSGSSAIAYSQAVTGLSSGTTYYYCAIAQSTSGFGFGAVVSFTTAGPPTVVTDAATALTSTGATLQGTGSPNLASSTGWFRYATSSPGSCNNTFGTRVPSSGGMPLGAGSAPVDYSHAVSGLAPGTTYYVCAIASNTYGTAYGTVVSFTTPGAQPVVTTSAATALTSTGATLNGSANPGGDTTTGWFRYATTDPGTCDDSFGTRAPTTGGTALGAGNASVSYNEALTGLSQGTTYFFCAIASNAEGTVFGSVLSFTTPQPPSVATAAATLVTDSTATLNGSANPNGATATGWFRYATTNPGTCDDSFGTRAPTTGGTALGAGTSSAPFSRALSGLSPNTTYYFCTIASNAYGAVFGSVSSFTTADAPSVTTAAATLVTSTSATFNGSANPNGASSTGWYRYATTNPGSCNDSFGTRAPSTGGTSLGSGTSSASFPQAVTGLTPGKTYYFCAIASNAYGTSYGAVLTFATPAASPVAVTSAASAITGTSARLNGSANPGGGVTSGWFRYATTNPGSCSDGFGIRAPASGGSDLGSGTSSASFSQDLSGLTPGTTYYFCAIASNAVGTGYGSVLSFSTPALAVVTTEAATALSSTGATLNALVNPTGTATSAWFRYGTTDPGSCDDSFGTRAPVSGGTALGAGSSPIANAQSLAGLSPSTTYYFCAIASNAGGMSFGAVLSFTTDALQPPVVTSEPATAITASSASLQGTANPNATSATGWFRYDTTDPGTCDDSFGTRIPATGGTALGSGTIAAPFSEDLADLAPDTTYYYCAIASNAVGTSFGEVLSFTTGGGLPAVTTSAATGTTSDGAALNATVTPNQVATTAWFRYDTTAPASCDDSFGTRVPASGGISAGAGATPVSISETLTGLAPDQTYYYCAIASNALGTSFGAVLSFTTGGALPTVTTNPPTGVSGGAAVLNGAVTANQIETTAWFRYATTQPASCDDSFGTRVPASGGVSVGAGTTPVAISQTITGLTPGQTYYFCALASNALGTAFGQVVTFSPDAVPPTVLTDRASAVTANQATLSGFANPNGLDATGYFRIGDTQPDTCSDAFGTRVPATGGVGLGSGSIQASFSQVASGLKPNTTYYFCAAASNLGGASFGQVVTFTTPGAAPTVRTVAVELALDGSLTLDGAANPNGADTTAWFRYDSTDPGTCDDTFGTRKPSTGGNALGDGTDEVAYSQSVTNLAPGTYYFCAVAQNATGTAFGEVIQAVVPGGDDTPPPNQSTKGSGCGCRSTTDSGSALLAMLGLLLFAGRRRKAD